MVGSCGFVVIARWFCHVFGLMEVSVTQAMPCTHTFLIVGTANTGWLQLHKKASCLRAYYLQLTSVNV